MVHLTEVELVESSSATQQVLQAVIQQLEGSYIPVLEPLSTEGQQEQLQQLQSPNSDATAVENTIMELEAAIDKLEASLFSTQQELLHKEEVIGNLNKRVEDLEKDLKLKNEFINTLKSQRNAALDQWAEFYTRTVLK